MLRECLSTSSNSDTTVPEYQRGIPSLGSARVPEGMTSNSLEISTSLSTDFVDALKPSCHLFGISSVNAEERRCTITLLSPFSAYPMTVCVCIIYRIDRLNTSKGYCILEGTLILHTKFLHVLPTSNGSTNGISFGQMK